MKRDLDLIRKILLTIEDHPDLLGPVQLDIDGYSPEMITYHVILLNEAGLIMATSESGYGGIKWNPDRLTWRGHEFLDAARNEQNWNKVKQVLARSGSMVFVIVEQLLLEMVKVQASKLLL